jgi:predicted transcriptional regulator of viral defense system
MTYAKQILELTSKNNGIITTAQITQAGIAREHIRSLVNKGLLIRSYRGIYITPAAFEDEMYTLQMRFKKGVYSHDTALFLLDLTDRTPLKYVMTFPLNYNTTALNTEYVKYYRVKNEFFDLGIITARSPMGHHVKTYNAERTLCDIIKGRSTTEIQIVTEAFKRYTRLKEKNIPLLSKYAKFFRVENKLRPYLEVLL